MAGFCDAHGSYSCAPLHAPPAPPAEHPLARALRMRREAAARAPAPAAPEVVAVATKRRNPIVWARKTRAVQDAAPRVAKPGLWVQDADHVLGRLAADAWHYTGKIPNASRDIFGVWEDGAFVGVVVFGPGATPQLYKPYCAFGVEQRNVAELVRVALGPHKAPVSRIVAICLRLLRKKRPELSLIISFADPKEGHHGGIYQAGGWLYLGKSQAENFYDIGGEVMHPRTVVATYGTRSIEALRQKAPDVRLVRMPGKHRYAFPLNDALRSPMKALSRPYPKRAGSIDTDAGRDQRSQGGGSPTPAHQVHPEATV